MNPVTIGLLIWLVCIPLVYIGYRVLIDIYLMEFDKQNDVPIPLAAIFWPVVLPAAMIFYSGSYIHTNFETFSDNLVRSISVLIQKAFAPPRTAANTQVEFRYHAYSTSFGPGSEITMSLKEGDLVSTRNWFDDSYNKKHFPNGRVWKVVDILDYPHYNFGKKRYTRIISAKEIDPLEVKEPSEIIFVK